MVVFFNPAPLDYNQLSRISEHKYKSSGKSLFEPIFQPFWNFCASKIPKRISPNALTFFGLIANVIGTIAVLYYSWNCLSDVPSVVCLLFAFCIFIYQTLDAVDGLHARRTNTCSQLGELFDHGCDAISITILPLGLLAIIGLGDYPMMMFIEFFIIISVFYTSHWQCYVTGYIGFDKISVTEGLVFCKLFSIISAIFGVEFWDYQIPIMNLQLKVLQLIILIIGGFVLFFRVGQTIVHGGSGKYGTTVANTSVLFPVCPLLLVIGSAMLAVTWSPSDIFRSQPTLFLLSFGLVMTKVSQNLVLAHMTRSPISLFDSVMFGPFCLLANEYIHCPLQEKFLLVCCCLWSTADVIHFNFRVCQQVATHLNLYVFRIERPPPNRPSVTDSISSRANRRRNAP